MFSPEVFNLWGVALFRDSVFIFLLLPENVFIYDKYQSKYGKRAKLNDLKSNSHAPNLHACIIYICVNILLVCIFAHANANTHGS